MNKDISNVINSIEDLKYTIGHILVDTSKYTSEDLDNLLDTIDSDLTEVTTGIKVITTQIEELQDNIIND